MEDLKIKKLFIFIFLLLSLQSGLVIADQFDDEVKDQFDQLMNAWANRNDVQGFNIMLPLAMQGKAKAQFLVGYMYAKGIGVAKDPVKATDFYSKAAAQGYALAQNALNNQPFVVNS